MSTSIEYRDAFPIQIDCFSLYLTTGWNRVYAISDVDYYTAVQRSWRMVCAYHQGGLIGMGRIVSDGVLYGLIVDVIVAPEFQRQGIGTQIMTRLLAACREAGLRDVKLFSAKGMSGFYRRFGFVERSGDAPAMEMRLVNSAQ